LWQLWIEKQILVPIGNRTCSSHLVNGHFTSSAINQIEATRFGVSRTGAEIAEWILSVTEEFLSKPMSALAKGTLSKLQKVITWNSVKYLIFNLFSIFTQQ